MAVSILSNSSNVGGAAATSRSYNHTCPSGTTLLLVRVALRGSTNTPGSVTASYGGTALTSVAGTSISNSGNRAHTVMLALPMPPVGQAQALAVSWSQSSTCILTGSNVAGSSSLPVGGAGVYGSSAAPGVFTGSSVSGALVIDSLVANSNRVLTPGSGLTAQYAQLATSTGNNDVAHRAATRPAAASVGMTWAMDSSANWVISACVLLPSSPPNSGSFFAFF